MNKDNLKVYAAILAYSLAFVALLIGAERWIESTFEPSNMRTALDWAVWLVIGLVGFSLAGPVFRGLDKRLSKCDDCETGGHHRATP